jgi:ATP-dependent RNA helicase DDX54/DBP10
MSALGFPTVDDDASAALIPAMPLPASHARSRRPREGPAAEAPPHVSRAADKAAVKHRPGSFPHLGLSEELCSALARKGYSFPTPIQRRVIPAVLGGRDVVAMARTGSGKTAAFLAPTLHRLAKNPRALSAAARRNGPRALVLAPTRELALQTLRFAKAYGRDMDPPIRSAVVVGGTPLEAHFEALAVCPELVIATPGRLLQMIAEMGMKGGLTMSTVETLILDEADRLFEGTLVAETSAVIDQLAPETDVRADRQTILVSATMPHALAEFTRSFLRQNVDVIRLDTDKAISPTLAIAFCITRSGDEKVASLITVVRRALVEESARSVVVFAATHRAVEYLVELLRTVLKGDVSHGKQDDCGGVVCVHGSMDQMARVESVALFRKRKARVLVVTDVAARGIDLPELDVVVNFDMSATPKLFVHRVGRVGRAGRPGMAVSLISADEAPYMIDTLLFLGRNLTFAGDTLTQTAHDPWKEHAVAMESTFVIGALPKACVDDDVEILNKCVQSNVELGKLRLSSTNAQGLYIKTRAAASGESVRRAKEIYNDSQGGSRSISVHPWFSHMESAQDRTARAHAALLSTWRPKDKIVSVPRLRKRVDHGDLIPNSNDTAGIVQHADPRELYGDSATMEVMHRAASVKKSGSAKSGVKKRSARQAALEDQRSQFYVPLRRDEGQVRNERAFKFGTGGTMGDNSGDGLGAFRAVQAAKMDIVADTNVDMSRVRHTGRKNNAFWDRVSKKFVKGGVTDKTSKQNVHVATREARSLAAGDAKLAAYGSADGSMFKKWLSKNRKAVEELREAGDVVGHNDGIGNNDFRRGSFGRKARIAALVARKKSGESGTGNPAKHLQTLRSVRSELKPVAQITKERKLKKKADARRIAKSKGKGRSGGPVKPRPEKRRGAAPPRSKVIVRHKGR